METYRCQATGNECQFTGIAAEVGNDFVNFGFAGYVDLYLGQVGIVSDNLPPGSHIRTVIDSCVQDHYGPAVA